MDAFVSFVRALASYETDAVSADEVRELRWEISQCEEDLQISESTRRRQDEKISELEKELAHVKQALKEKDDKLKLFKGQVKNFGLNDYLSSEEDNEGDDVNALPSDAAMDTEFTSKSADLGSSYSDGNTMDTENIETALSTVDGREGETKIKSSLRPIPRTFVKTNSMQQKVYRLKRNAVPSSSATLMNDPTIGNIPVITLDDEDATEPTSIKRVAAGQAQSKGRGNSHILRRRSDSQGRRFHCSQCQKKCVSQHKLKLHFMRAHKRRSYRYTCKQCRKAFSVKKN